MEVCHFFHVSVSFNLTELLYSTHILMPCVCAVFEHMVGNDASANLCQRKLYSGFASSFFFPPMWKSNSLTTATQMPQITSDSFVHQQWRSLFLPCCFDQKSVCPRPRPRPECSTRWLRAASQAAGGRLLCLEERWRRGAGQGSV